MTDMGVGFTTVKYLETPPSAKELKRLFQEAGLRPQDTVRTAVAKTESLR